MTREQRLVFGEVADLYDRVRPDYPETLVDDVLSFSGIDSGDRALEVGPGTGRATLRFAARGLAITGVEPSAEMAAVARARLSGHPEVSIVVGLFEEYDGPGDFRLVFGGQSWHWVPLEHRYAKAHAVLAPGGAYAAFWNRPDWAGNDDLRARLDAVYDRLAPDIPSRGPGSAWTNVSGLEDETLAEIEGSGLLVDAEVRHYPHRHHYATADYLDLLRTQSDHRLLDDDHRERLLEAVAQEVDAAGGAVDLGYVTVLYLARRA